MKTLLIALMMLTALPGLSQDAQKQKDSSSLDLETLQYVESEFRKCDRVKLQAVKDGLTIVRYKSAAQRLQEAVSSLELQNRLLRENNSITGVQLDVEKEKKTPWWKIALYILTAALSGYGLGTM